MSISFQQPMPAGSAFWNDTPFKTCLFDAFSVLLPEGEAFVIDTVQAAALTLDVGDPLQEAALRFVAEERSHQRAHRLYNRRLAAHGYPVQQFEQRIRTDLTHFTEHFSVHQRLCLAAAFEQITSVLSKAALRPQKGWLSAKNSVQARLWRWHCAEEIARAHVTLDLIRACGVPGWQRIAFYLLASVLLASDVVKHIGAFYRFDKAQAPGLASSFWKSTFSFVSRGMGMRRLLADWAGYFLPLRWQGRNALAGTQSPIDGLSQRSPSAVASDTDLAMLPPTCASSPAAECRLPDSRLQTRFLQLSDIPALLALEHQKWEPGQAARADEMIERIKQFPHLSLGTFDVSTGAAMASLFMKPTSLEVLMQSANWHECADSQPVDNAKALFGISFSSTRPEAGDALFEFFWPHALKAGWRHIYLGSPVPGFKKWLASNPGGSVYRYVHSTCNIRSPRSPLPRDPQLRYYSKRGFRQIVYIRPNYFPHEASQDYGVLIRGTVPLSLAAPLWKRLPVSWLQALKKSLFLLL